MREPAYKHILQARDMKLEEFNKSDVSILDDMGEELDAYGYDLDVLREYLGRKDVKTVVIRDGKLGNKAVAAAAVSRLDSIDRSARSRTRI